jgi:AraC-like DNA-binding protein
LRLPPIPFFVEVPMDEVLAPVLSLVLKLLYILPEGHALTVVTLKKQDAETGDHFLRIEVRSKRLFFNPNLIFKPDNNRFKVEAIDQHNPVIFIEWPISATAEPAELPAALNGKQRLELANQTNDIILNSDFYHNKIVSRFEEFGKSAFVHDKLKATKSRGDTEFLENVINCIYKHINSPDFDSSALERSLGISKTQLFRKLKQLTGYSAANFIRHIRLLKASELLQSTELPIREVAERVGFNELSYFSSSFLSEFKTSATEWRKAQKAKQ